ncbi:MAG: hypothetical protein J5846_02520 [Desulfovibrio sp.]|nr:hypothetical protein [Desulfovibrio sp.]
MTEVSVDLEKILNLKHKAVIQALLSTKLSNQEIADKLQISRALFYYIAQRYLPKGYLVQRNQALQLEALRNLASTIPPSQSSSETNDADEVMVLSIPSQSSELAPCLECEPGRNPPTSPCESPGPKPQICEPNSLQQPSQAELLHLRPRQLDIYRLIDQMMSEEGMNHLPTQKELRIRVAQEFQVHASNRDIGAALAQWTRMHPVYSHTRRSLQFSDASQTSPKPYSRQEMVTISLERQGVKISWQTSASNREESILKILHGIR